MAFNYTFTEPLQICILTIGFWPIEIGYAGRQALVLAEVLAREGHKVSVVTTFPINPNSKRSFNYGLITREQLNGIKVIRVPALRPTRRGLGRKFLFYLSFAFTSLTALPSIRKADVIFGLHPPAPFLILPGFLFSHILRSKYIIRVTDLWPDVLIDFGILKSKPARKVAALVTTLAYRVADHIMTFTPDIKHGIMKYGIPNGKISVVEIAIDTSLFRPVPVTKSESVGLGFPSLDAKFVVLYSGAFALTYDFDTFLEAAKNLEHFEDILFVLLGDGESKNHIRGKISESELSNIIMLPPVSQAELVAKYINCSDVCVVPLKPEMGVSMITRPSKIFEFWACGKPVITCSEGAVSTLIEESQAGIALQPGEPILLAKAIEFLYLNRDVATGMGKRGRQFVLDRFSYKVLETNLREVIEQVILTK